MFAFFFALNGIKFNKKQITPIASKFYCLHKSFNFIFAHKKSNNIVLIC